MFLCSLLVGDKAKHAEDERFEGNKPDFIAVGLTTPVARRYRKPSSFPLLLVRVRIRLSVVSAETPNA